MRVTPPEPAQFRVGRPIIRLRHEDGTETVHVCPEQKLPPLPDRRGRAVFIAGLAFLSLLGLTYWLPAAAPLLLLAMPSVIPIAFKVMLFSGRAWKAALYVGAANLGNSTAGYSATNEVVGAGYNAGGKVLAAPVTGFAFIGSDGVTVLVDYEDVEWAAASFTARYILVYDNNAPGKEGFVIDMGVDQQISGGTFSIEWPEPDLLTAILQAA